MVLIGGLLILLRWRCTAVRRVLPSVATNRNINRKTSSPSRSRPWLTLMLMLTCTGMATKDETTNQRITVSSWKSALACLN